MEAERKKEDCSAVGQSSKTLMGSYFLLAEVALEQAFESLAMASLVAGHFMHGVMDGVEVKRLGHQSQLELAGGRAVARHENRLFAALRAAKRLIFFASRGTNTSFPDSTLGKPVNTGS